METDFTANSNLGFSSIYEEYERLSQENPCDIYRRNLIRNHVEKYLNPNENILEINAGSGIDAAYFAQKGYTVLATDMADGAELHVNEKIKKGQLDNLSFQKCSYNELHQIASKKFNHIFSNYGGLNCTADLDAVFRQFADLVLPGGFVTLVIMPKYYPWEWLTLFKGNKNALRRLGKEGTIAQVNGHSIPTYYHSPKKVKKAMGSQFKHIATRNIGTFYPSQHYKSWHKPPKIINSLMRFDTWMNSKWFMPKGIGDYFIITFQKTA